MDTANLSNLKAINDTPDIGTKIHDFIRELYPICRSITGDGVRDTLRRVGQHIPLALHEVPTGTQVFDWTVPREWNINDAYVKNPEGVKIIDFKKSNLHVLNYSIPIHKTVSLTELREHLFTLPNHPNWIPYRTSYYNENWGFCISHSQFMALEDGNYEICIDTSLKEGHLTYGECYLPGESTDEILISCHICHPSLCNDSISGVALSTFLAKHLLDFPLSYSYRFLFIPATIGSITWLAINESRVNRIKHGLVVTCVGDPGKLTYKKSRQGNTEVDRAAIHVLSHTGEPYEILDFSPYGYDERQFCSPGFNLPVGSLSRSRDACYPEYHTSADNLEFVKPASLASSFAAYLSTLLVLEKNNVYLNQNQKCEPQLGKRGLYRKIGGIVESPNTELAILWVLNLSDSTHSLLDIAERANLPFELISSAADQLLQAGLLKNIIR